MKRYSLLIALQLFLAIGCQAKSYKYAVLCDTRSDASKSGVDGVNVAALNAICADIKKNGAEFVLAPGDFICGNVKWYNEAGKPPTLDAQYGSFLEALAKHDIGLPNTKSKITLYPVRGNHECYHDIESTEQIKKAWLNNIGKTLPTNGPEGEKGFTYWFKKHGDLFIGTDQFMRTDSSGKKGIVVNQPWLDSVMKKEAGEVVVFGHTPAFSAHHKDCLAEDPIARDTFIRSISQRSGVYFCGHDHFYARASIPFYKKDNTTISGYLQQSITPSGAPFLTGNRTDNHKWSGVYADKDAVPESYMDNVMGYQLVTVDGDNVTVQFIATSDGSCHTINKCGIYEYSFNSNWKQWDFAVRDQFSYKKLTKTPAQENPKIKVIVDTDMGWDDVLSLLYLMKNPDIEIIGVTVTGCGETHLDAAVQLALSLMEMGKQNAVVCRGTDKPTSFDHKFPELFRKDMDNLMGLRDTLPQPTRKVDARPAWQYLSETLNSTDESISILSLGGFTNLGMMLKKYPATDLSKVSSVYTMGGAVYVDGNISALNGAQEDWDQGSLYSSNTFAEWNIFVDPVAAEKVLESELPVTLIPLDACDYVMLGKSYIKTITANDPIATLARNIFEKKTGPSSEGIPVPIFDPLATMIMAGGMSSYQMNNVPLKVNVTETTHNNHCGKTYVTIDDSAKKCRVVQGVSATTFANEFARILNGKKSQQTASK